MATAILSVKRTWSARPLYVASIFLGSFLLFLMQPMIARMALPRLGGAPAVWNSAMLVYQTLLLAGYAYAHAVGRLRPRMQGAVHLMLLGFAALWLPLGLGATVPSAGASPILWVPWLLISCIGPVFFVVSAQAPLIQRWFAIHAPNANPYALYAASNLGSFGGLIVYPLLIEPLLPIPIQSGLWSAGYILLGLLVAGCVMLLPQRAAPSAAEPLADGEPAPSIRRRLHWIALAAIPSGLILATTTHITTDVLAMPLIWVVPLGLYLLSFTFAFADTGRVAALATRLFPIILIFYGATAVSGGASGSLWLLILGDLMIMFTAAVVLHHRMYQLRPGTGRLTEFYLYMSLGGVIGGIFCALIAPAVFDWLYEYPLLIIGAALLTPLCSNRVLSPVQRRWLPLLAIMLSLYVGGLVGPPPPTPIWWVGIAVLAGLAWIAAAARPAFVMCLVALILGFGGWTNLVESARHHGRVRSYFGIYTIGELGDGVGKKRALIHGTTVHGIQLLTPGLERYPTSYYAYRSGIGIAMRAAPAIFGPHARIGVVGLGAGTLSCYAQPGQDWRIYEIDPAIVRIARNPRDFTFLSHCLPDVPISLGDARLTLTREPTASRDLLAIDAFSSDAIPMHLLTREAVGIYSRVLAPDGLLMFHISNRYIDLEPVLAAAAATDGFQVMVRVYQPDAHAAAYMAVPSVWVAMSRSPATMQRLRASDPQDHWRAISARAGMAAWTDNYGSILPLLKH